MPPLRLDGRTFVITGVGRGLGAAFAIVFAEAGASVILTGRDVTSLEATRDGIAAASASVGDVPRDALLYPGGNWEHDAFTADYDLATCSNDDIERIIAVNLTAPMRLAQALLPALHRADNPRIIFMGALSGLDNFPAREVAPFDHVSSPLFCLAPLYEPPVVAQFTIDRPGASAAGDLRAPSH